MQQSALVFASILILNALTVSAARAENPKTLVQQYLRLVETDPENCGYNDLLGGAYQLAGDLGLAVERFEKALRLCPDRHLTRHQLGITKLLMGDKGGLSIMEQAAKAAEDAGERELAALIRQDRAIWENSWLKAESRAEAK